MECLAVKFRKDKIIIKLLEYDFNYFSNFVIKSRKEKEVYYIDADKNYSENSITLSYSSIDITAEKLSYYDLYVSTTNCVESRLFLKSSSNLKKYCYQEVYYYSSFYGFKFYLTRNNEISLVFGNYFEIESFFCPKVSFDVFIRRIKVKRNYLVINFDFLAYPSLKKAVLVKNKKEYNLIEDSIKYENNGCYEIKLSIDHFFVNEQTKIDNIFVFFALENVCFMGKLVFTIAHITNALSENIEIFAYKKNNDLILTKNIIKFISNISENVENSEIEIIDLYFLNNFINLI